MLQQVVYLFLVFVLYPPSESKNSTLQSVCSWYFGFCMLMMQKLRKFKSTTVVLDITGGQKSGITHKSKELGKDKGKRNQVSLKATHHNPQTPVPVLYCLEGGL